MLSRKLQTLESCCIEDLTKSLCQKGDSNPRPHKRTRNLHSSPIKGQGFCLESGALDHSAILTCILCFRNCGQKQSDPCQVRTGDLQRVKLT